MLSQCGREADELEPGTAEARVDVDDARGELDLLERTSDDERAVRVDPQRAAADEHAARGEIARERRIVGELDYDRLSVHHRIVRAAFSWGQVNAAARRVDTCVPHGSGRA